MHKVILPVILMLLLSACSTLPNRMMGLKADAFNKFRELPEKKRKEIADEIAGGIKQHDPDAKCKALYALAKIPNESKTYVVEIADLLRDGNPRVKSCALHALVGIGSHAVPLLISSLESSESTEKVYAARSLAIIWHKRTDSPPNNDSVLPNSDELAGHAVSNLIPLLRDPDQDVAKAASEALIAIGVPSVHAVREFLVTAGDADGRSRALRILGKIGPGSKEAIPDLLQLASTSEGSVNTETIITLINAGHKLAEINGIQPVISGGNLDARRMVAAALSKRGAESVPYFVEMLKSEDPLTRSQAAGFLGFVGVPARTAIPQLIATLGDIDASVRRQVSAAISRIGPDESVVPALLEAMKDNDWQVVIELEASVKKVGPPAIPIVLDAIKKTPADVKFNPLAAGCSRAASMHPAFARSMVPKTRECLEYWDLRMLQHVLGELRGGKLSGEQVQGLSKEEVERQVGILHSLSGTPKLLAAKQLVRYSPDSFSKVLPVLIEFLNSDHYSIRLEAIELLGEIGPTAEIAVPALNRKLREDQTTKVKAAFALWKIKKSRMAVSILISSLDSNEDDIKLYSMAKLEEMGVDACKFLPQIRKMLRSENYLDKTRALKSLAGAKGNTEKALPELIELLDYRNDTGIQETAAKVIGSIGAGARSAIPKLMEGLNSKYRNEIERSASALAGIGRPAVPDLIAVLLSDKETASEGAAIALGKMGPLAADAIPALIEIIGKSENLAKRQTFERYLRQIDPVVTFKASR